MTQIEPAGNGPFAGLRPPTILQVIPTLDAGGAERTTVDITHAIVAAGGRALVVSSGGRLVPEIERAGGTHIEMAVQSKNPVIMALNVERLTRLLQKQNVDLVHARSRAPGWSALAAARRTGTPFVTTYHSKVHESPRLKVFYNSVMTRGDAVIANSNYTAERIRRIHKADDAKIFTVPRGVDLKAFDPDGVSHERIAALRADWGLPPVSPPVLLLPARLTRWKGQAVAIEAMHLLKADGVSPRLVLVGDAQGRNEYLATLKKQVAGHGLGDEVIFAGHCDDMAAAYATSDAVLSPALDPEPFGRVAPEAQAMQRPVIVSDAGGARETVIDCAADPARATGWRVPAGDAGALAEAIRAFLRMDPEDRRHMGQRGRANVVANFSLETMCRRTLEVYDRLLRARHG